MARPEAPLSRVTSTSTVGLPRESTTCRPMTASMRPTTSPSSTRPPPRLNATGWDPANPAGFPGMPRTSHPEGLGDQATANGLVSIGEVEALSGGPFLHAPHHRDEPGHGTAQGVLRVDA